MKKYLLLIKVLTTLLCIISILSLMGCGGDPEPDPTPTPPPATPSPTPSTPEPTPEPVNLVPYEGNVEHIFIHEVLAFPEVTFNGNNRQGAFDQFYVTVYEFNKMLEELHRNDYALINLNDIWSEYLADDGQRKMRRNQIMFPEGKRPLIISFDDINFYSIDIPYGLMSRYIVGIDGEIWAEGNDPDGNYIISQEFTAITILDRFVRENPDFSHNGAKGCIALTGFEGILGYRTHNNREDTSESARVYRMQEIARVRPVVQRLKETGWYFASHSYGHINLENNSLERVKSDADRWLEEVGSLVGETKIFIYPFGSRLDGRDQEAPGPAFQYYVETGFRFFASVGQGWYNQIKSDRYNISAVTMDRAAIDGTTLRHQRNSILRFFDAKDVFDPLRPTEYGNSWE